MGYRENFNTPGKDAVDHGVPKAPKTKPPSAVIKLGQTSRVFLNSRNCGFQFFKKSLGCACASICVPDNRHIGLPQPEAGTQPGEHSSTHSAVQACMNFRPWNRPNIVKIQVSDTFPDLSLPQPFHVLIHFTIQTVEERASQRGPSFGWKGKGSLKNVRRILDPWSNCSLRSPGRRRLNTLHRDLFHAHLRYAIPFHLEHGELELSMRNFLSD